MVKKITFHKLKESQQQVDLRAYENIRNKAKKVIRAAKRAEKIDLARHCDKDSKTFLSFYKFKAVPKKSVGPLKVNYRLVKRDSEIVKHLNANLQSIFTT